MSQDKIDQLVKMARAMTKEERNRKARAKYRAGGAQVRRKNKLQSRKYRRQGGQTLKARQKLQRQRLKYKPTRIRKEPLQKRPRDMS